MNKKIKEIDIKAFRAYKDEQKFDFTHCISGNVADLIVIYAPNGFGKTSFFDAVEWAVTGTIERLRAGRPIKEEVKIQKDYILKNRDSDEEYGNVKIISEDNGIFSVNTKRLTRNMRSDFKEGKVEIISPELETICRETKSFCTTNLLAHDKITGFLQNYTAEAKTDELKVMWDENNYSEILADINELYVELEKRQKELSIKITEEEKELNKYVYANDQSDKTINLLADYEEKYNKRFMKKKTFKIDEMLLLFNQFYLDSQKEKEEQEKKYNDSIILINDYQQFANNKKKLTMFQKLKKEYDEAITKCNKFEQIRGKQEKINRELEQILNVLGNIEDFYNYANKINSNLKELHRIEKLKIDSQRDKIGSGEIKHNLNKEIHQNNDIVVKLSEKEKKLKRDYYEYNSKTAQKIKYEALCEKAKYILEERKNRVLQWFSYIDQIDLFLKGKSGIGLLLIDNIFSYELVYKYDQIEKLNKYKKMVRENIDTLEKSKNSLIGFFDKFQQLSIIGKDIINEKKQRECPLCHMRYENYEQLLSKIDIASKENLELEKINVQINKNKEKELEIDKELKDLVEAFQSQTMAISHEYEIKLENENKKINNLQMKVNEWKQIIHTAAFASEQLKEKYLLEKIDISIHEQVNKEMVRIEKKIKKINENTTVLLNKIKNEEKKENELEKKINDYELKILSIKEDNNQINANYIFVEVKKYLEKQRFYNPNYEYNEMKEAIENEYKQLSKQKILLAQEIKSFYNKDMSSKEDYALKLAESQKEINKLEVDASSYLLRCKKLIEVVDEEQLLQSITKASTTLENYLKHINNRIQSETTILSNLSRLKEQRIWLDKKSKLESNKIQLLILNKRIGKLRESKKYVENYIVDKTNEYFNSDIINQIYNKIDPHPTMKHIKFLTQRENDGLKTRIYTYDESENNKMSPVVYLSSAQVNILSLCIFLSKVLNEKNTTFNTIFIDDPIQHLDGINLLSFIDLLRTIITDLDRQIVISTHNEQFYKLLRVKMDEKYYASKFIELTSTGRIKI